MGSKLQQQSSLDRFFNGTGSKDGGGNGINGSSSFSSLASSNSELRSNRKSDDSASHSSDSFLPAREELHLPGHLSDEYIGIVIEVFQFIITFG